MDSAVITESTNAASVLIPFAKVFLPLSAALGLSLVVERTLEVGQNVFERLFGATWGRRAPETQVAGQVTEKLEARYTQARERDATETAAEQKLAERVHIKAQLDGESGADKRAQLQAQLKALEGDTKALEGDTEIDERHAAATVLCLDATDPDDGTTTKAFVLQLLGFATGILLARYFDVRLFVTMLSQLVDLRAIDYLMTGLLIGGGSAPMHTLIRFISERKVLVEPESVKAPTPAAADMTTSEPGRLAAPSPNLAIADWEEIPYDGGVDVALLEGIHKRGADPDMVIYHHTAMSSTSSFDDVVRVIKSRKDSSGKNWVTGYNCVVTADGVIHPFCRWDRYGNHATGYNRRSLGLSFNGNYETDAKVPFSNPDRRLGPPQPTEVQLRAAARLVALWTFIYPIKADDFANSIIPHNQVSSKTCPGTNFPYKKFQELIQFYRLRWKADPAVRARIAAFKQKPYLYA